MISTRAQEDPLAKSYARRVLHEDLSAIVELLDDPGGGKLVQQGVAFVHPEHSCASVVACLDNFQQGAFVSEAGGGILGYANASRLHFRVALATHTWSAKTGNGIGISHDPAGKWLYV